MSCVQLLVIAKAPRPGRVKTRLCPPCTPRQAARLAAAALADTLEAVGRTPAVRRVLALDGVLEVGDPPLPPGMCVVPQRGEGLGERLAAAFADTALPGVATLLVGMDTPQVTPALLAATADALVAVLPGEPDVPGPDAARPHRPWPDAVLGPAADGGWWALGLRDPAAAEVLRTVPMSTPDTGRLTLEALRRRGLRVDPLPVLRDVDTVVDAVAVAGRAPDTRFARAVAAVLAGPAVGTPAPTGRGLVGPVVGVPVPAEPVGTARSDRRLEVGA